MNEAAVVPASLRWTKTAAVGIDPCAGRARPGLGALARADRSRHARDQGPAARAGPARALARPPLHLPLGQPRSSGSTSPKARCARPATAASARRSRRSRSRSRSCSSPPAGRTFARNFARSRRCLRSPRRRAAAVSLVDTLRDVVGAANVHRRRRSLDLGARLAQALSRPLARRRPSRLDRRGRRGRDGVPRGAARASSRKAATRGSSAARFPTRAARRCCCRWRA